LIGNNPGASEFAFLYKAQQLCQSAPPHARST
jgi:hypothetical protein